MRKVFEKPEMNISMFEVEEIRTAAPEGLTSAGTKAWNYFENNESERVKGNIYVLR